MTSIGGMPASADAITPAAGDQRLIAFRTRGRSHGPVTRLVSPGDVGELIKPFVFLDLFAMGANTTVPFGMHPHSGIATFTLLVDGELQFLNRHGEPGSQKAGGIEWMMAGGGVWHGSPLTSLSPVNGFQLWVALPPTLESAEPEEIFLLAADVPVVGPARLLLGEYGGERSVVAAPSPMTYLHVTLKAGESWTFVPPAGQTVAWIAVHEGIIGAPEPIATGELVVFEESEGQITFTSEGRSGFVLGAAVKHPHDLVTGYYSVHTSRQTLIDGEARIAQLGAELRASGRIS